MASAFSPDGSEPLGRTLRGDRLRPATTELVEFYQLERVVEFLEGFEGEVALQLNDRLLCDSLGILRYLRGRSKCSFCVVGDSTYGQGDLDEISAAHLGCGRIIFFGEANLKSPKSTTQSLFIQLDRFDPAKVAEAVKLATDGLGEDFIILSSNSNHLIGCPAERTAKLDLDIVTTDREGVKNAIYVGEGSDEKIVAWCLQHQPTNLITVNPLTGEIKKNPFDTGRLLMRRFHLIERAKDAERVGLVLGSNGGAGLSVACLNRLRELALASGKTPYTVVVGDPTPQKLANFPELDIFVLVGSPEASILQSKAYYKPVIHPWEFAMAASGDEWDGSYWANWEKILEKDEITVNLKEHDISLITGKVRTLNTAARIPSNPEASVMIKGSSEIAEMAAHAIRRERKYFGLETTETAEKAAVLKDGTSGIAQGYEREQH